MRVLLVPAGSHGDVHPFVGLGIALKARGHEVHLITAEPFRHLAADVGFDDFAPVGTAEDYEQLTQDPNLWHPSRSLKALFGNSERTSRCLRDAYHAIAKRYRPGETVAIAGSISFGARIAHDRLGIPLATIHLQPVGMYSVASPARYANLHVRSWWPRWVARLAYWVGDRYVIDPVLCPPLNEFRRELGLPPIDRLFSGWIHAPQLVLGMFPAWYGSAPDWPKQLRLTGFVRYDQADSAAVPPEVESFLAAGDPPIVFSFGSAMRQGLPYFTAAVEACQILGKRGLMLAKGKAQVPANLPPTVLHADYAPFSKVFPRAAAVVHHGGIGTCAQGLTAGVPQLVMAMSFDQPDNATRLEKLGVGRWLWPKQFTGRRVATALRELIGQPVVVARCREVAGWMATTHPAQEACELIESLAGTDRACVPHPA